MRWRPSWMRPRAGAATVVRGAVVKYVGPERDDVMRGAHGTVVSDVHGPMDVRPYATPPTVPEFDPVEICVQWRDGRVSNVGLDEVEALPL